MAIQSPKPRQVQLLALASLRVGNGVSGKGAGGRTGDHLQRDRLVFTASAGAELRNPRELHVNQLL